MVIFNKNQFFFPKHFYKVRSKNQKSKNNLSFLNNMNLKSTINLPYPEIRDSGRIEEKVTGTDGHDNQVKNYFRLQIFQTSLYMFNLSHGTQAVLEKCIFFYKQCNIAAPGVTHTKQFF
jgi:hypothetical protein